MSEVIQFEDRVRVEIAANPQPGRPVADGQVSKVAAKFEDAVKGVQAIIKPTVEAVNAAVKGVQVQELKIEFGLAFSAQGQLVVVNGKVEGTLKVTISVKA